MYSPTAIDLFSGCGGLTLGLKQAGFTVIGAVDVDALSVETYEANHPEVVVWHTDIRTLDVSSVKRRLDLRKGQLDLLAGCPPCQGFSCIRTLNGARAARDPRNNLVFEFLRFVNGLMPKAIMMENVPALAADERLARLQQELSACGYLTECRILDAADYGVPQRRRRMILLGSRIGAVDFPPPCQRRGTVRDAIGDLPRPGESGDELHDVPVTRAPHVLAMIRRIPRNGGGRTHLGRDSQLPCHRRCDGFKDVYGRMAWDDVAPTITSGCINPSKGRFLHPQEDRAITLREAALLQGFPDDYWFSLRRGKYPAAAMIGNALPPEFVRQQAEAIHRHVRILVKERAWRRQTKKHSS